MNIQNDCEIKKPLDTNECQIRNVIATYIGGCVQ